MKDAKFSHIIFDMVSFLPSYIKHLLHLLILPPLMSFASHSVTYKIQFLILKDDASAVKPKSAPFVIPDKDYENVSPQSQPTASKMHEGKSAEARNIAKEMTHDKNAKELTTMHHERRQQQPSEAQKQSVQENPESLYQNGLILSSIRNPQISSNSHDRLGSQTTLDSNYDIDDVANELIRLSEEQQSYDAHL